MLSKKLLKAFCCVMLALTALAPVAQAADYPNKPIKMVVPFGPGGSSDIAARILAKYMAKYLKVEVPVVNITGAAGFAGTLQVANAKPDGYTLLNHLPTFMTSYHTGTARFTWDAMDPIARVQQFTEVLAVAPDAPWKSAEELVTYAKANPGKVKWGLNIGAGLHFMALNFADASDTVGMWQYTQTGGDETSVKALLGKHVDVIGTGDSVALQHYKAGTMRLLGAFTDERIGALPDVPTFKEQGIDSVFVFDITIYGPKGTDENAKKVLQKAYQDISKDPEYLKEMAAQSLVAAYLDGKALVDMLVDQDVEFYKFARLGNLIPERQ